MSKTKLTQQEVDYLIKLVEWYDSEFDISYAIKQGRATKQVIEALELAHEKNMQLIEKLKGIKFYGWY